MRIQIAAFMKDVGKLFPPICTTRPMLMGKTRHKYDVGYLLWNKANKSRGQRASRNHEPPPTSHSPHELVCHFVIVRAEARILGHDSVDSGCTLRRAERAASL